MVVAQHIVAARIAAVVGMSDDKATVLIPKDGSSNFYYAGRPESQLDSTLVTQTATCPELLSKRDVVILVTMEMSGVCAMRMCCKRQEYLYP